MRGIIPIGFSPLSILYIALVLPRPDCLIFAARAHNFAVGRPGHRVDLTNALVMGTSEIGSTNLVLVARKICSQVSCSSVPDLQGGVFAASNQ
jgi:hypothetical protein